MRLDSDTVRFENETDVQKAWTFRKVYEIQPHSVRMLRSRVTSYSIHCDEEMAFAFEDGLSVQQMYQGVCAPPVGRLVFRSSARSRGTTADSAADGTARHSQ